MNFRSLLIFIVAIGLPIVVAGCGGDKAPVASSAKREGQKVQASDTGGDSDSADRAGSAVMKQEDKKAGALDRPCEFPYRESADVIYRYVIDGEGVDRSTFAARYCQLKVKEEYFCTANIRSRNGGYGGYEASYEAHDLETKKSCVFRESLFVHEDGPDRHDLVIDNDTPPHSGF